MYVYTFYLCEQFNELWLQIVFVVLWNWDGSLGVKKPIINHSCKGLYALVMLTKLAFSVCFLFDFRARCKQRHLQQLGRDEERDQWRALWCPSIQNLLQLSQIDDLWSQKWTFEHVVLWKPGCGNMCLCMPLCVCGCMCVCVCVCMWKHIYEHPSDHLTSVLIMT